MEDKTHVIDRQLLQHLGNQNVTRKRNRTLDPATNVVRLLVPNPGGISGDLNLLINSEQ